MKACELIEQFIREDDMSKLLDLAKHYLGKVVDEYSDKITVKFPDSKFADQFEYAANDMFDTYKPNPRTVTVKLDT